MLFDEYISSGESELHTSPVTSDRISHAESDRPARGPAAAARRPEAAGEALRHFPSAGVTVTGPYLAFYEHFGPTICGTPLTDEIMFEGRRLQVFEHLVLEEHAEGRVRPRALGSEWLTRLSDVVGVPGDTDAVQLIDVVERLPSLEGASAYARRPLADIRYIVIHHTGTSSAVSPEAIATEHVESLGWPGIGYHFVVGVDGTVWQTQDLTTVSHHARQFNAVSVGIALVGDLLDSAPPTVQLERTAALTAEVLDQLGLPISTVRGHRELVDTRCPGDAFMRVWRPLLINAVKNKIGLAAQPLPRS